MKNDERHEHGAPGEPKPTALMDCPSCGIEYIDYAELKADPDRLCATCFKGWDGLTLEQIMGLPELTMP